MSLTKSKVEQERIVDECIAKHGKFLIAILQDLQKRYNFLPEETMKTLAKKTEHYTSGCLWGCQLL